MKILTTSVITCPNCGHQKPEEMPVEACHFFYECENCKTILNHWKAITFGELHFVPVVAFTVLMEPFNALRNKIRNNKKIKT